MLTDPVADMLTRIRNANKALHDTAAMPSSRMKQEIARLLKEEGYIKDYRVERRDGETYDTLVVELKYGRNRERVITGQHSNPRKSRKSIAQFKLREGNTVGVAVTLRGARMYEFLDRLIAIAIPRIRDFRGLPAKFDGRGNYTLGVKEQIIFPEIDYDAVDRIRGLDVTMTTTAQTDGEALALLRGLGLPFAEDRRND